MSGKQKKIEEAKREIEALEVYDARIFKMLECAPAELKDDYDFMLEMSTKHSAKVLVSASDRLKDDSDFMLEVAKKHTDFTNPTYPPSDGCRKISSYQLMWDLRYRIIQASIFPHLSDRLRDDIDFMSQIATESAQATTAPWLVLRYISKRLEDDADAMLKLAEAYGQTFMSDPCTAELRSDPSFMLKVIKKNGSGLAAASDSLKNDSDFMLEVAKVKGAGFVCWRASKRLRDDLKFMRSLVMIGQVAEVWECASKRLKYDHWFALDVMRCADAKESIEMFKSIPAVLQESREFISNCLKANEYLPFLICRAHKANSSIWHPDSRTLANYKIKGLERMVEKGNLEKFCKYAQEFKCVQKNPNILSDSSPQAVLAMIKKEIAPLRYLFTKVRGEVRSILGIKSADQQNQNKKKGLCL